MSSAGSYYCIGIFIIIVFYIRKVRMRSQSLTCMIFGMVDLTFCLLSVILCISLWYFVSDIWEVHAAHTRNVNKLACEIRTIYTPKVLSFGQWIKRLLILANSFLTFFFVFLLMSFLWYRHGIYTLDRHKKLNIMYNPIKFLFYFIW